MRLWQHISDRYQKIYAARRCFFQGRLSTGVHAWLHGPAIMIRLLITVRKRRRLTSLFWRGVRPPIVPWPIIRRMLYAIIPNSSISALVVNFPDGSRSRSMSVFTSLWNCSHSPWAWYRRMCTYICYHRRIAVNPFVGSWNTFLFGFRIIHRCHIDIYRNKTICKSCRLYFVCKEHLNILPMQSIPR